MGRRHCAGCLWRWRRRRFRGTDCAAAAGHVGAALYADATALRPLIANAVWTYRGVEARVNPLGPPTIYSNIVTQQAGAGGAVTESASNADNAGASVQTVATQAGAVRAVHELDLLGNGSVRNIAEIELRSPVRVDDQYTVLDEHLSDGGVDLDGDGKNDALDVAIYRRVLGEEVIDLVSRSQVRSVRVKTYVLLRFTLSADGSRTDIDASLEQWYAPGLGVVKRVSDVPGEAVGSRLVSTETLVNWDGVNQGLGLLDPRPAQAPAGARLKAVVDATAFDTHALLMTFAGDFAIQGIALSTVDTRGHVTSTRTYAGITAHRARMVRVGDAARVIAMNDSGMQLHAYDAMGAAAGFAPTLIKPGGVYAGATGEEFVAASSGNTIWVAWIEPPADPMGTLYVLQAQAFDAAGQALAAPTVFATVTNPLSIGSLKASGADGHVIFVWDERDSAGLLSKRYALVDGAGAPTPTLHTALVANDSVFAAHPVATAAGRAMLWRHPVNGGPLQLHGVAFDAGGHALRSNGAGLETEHIALPWLSNTQALLVSGGATIDTYQTNWAKTWPEDALENAQSIVTELSPSGGPLATGHGARLLARGVFPAPAKMVGLPGNVLLFADEPDGVTVTSVWRGP